MVIVQPLLLPCRQQLGIDKFLAYGHHSDVLKAKPRLFTKGMGRRDFAGHDDV